MRRMHARCILVRGRSFKCFKCFNYCPPKTSEDALNTRAVYSIPVQDVVLNVFYVYCPPKQAKLQGMHSSCIRVRGRCFKCFKCLLSTKNTRRYSECTRRVFGCGDVVLNILNVYCPPKTSDDAANTRAVYSGAGTLFKMFTVHQKIAMMRQIHAPCIRVRGHCFKYV